MPASLWAPLDSAPLGLYSRRWHCPIRRIGVVIFGPPRSKWVPPIYALQIRAVISFPGSCVSHRPHCGPHPSLHRPSQVPSGERGLRQRTEGLDCGFRLPNGRECGPQKAPGPMHQTEMRHRHSPCCPSHISRGGADAGTRRVPVVRGRGGGGHKQPATCLGGFSPQALNVGGVGTGAEGQSATRQSIVCDNTPSLTASYATSPNSFVGQRQYWTPPMLESERFLGYHLTT